MSRKRILSCFNILNTVTSSVSKTMSKSASASQSKEKPLKRLVKGDELGNLLHTRNAGKESKVLGAGFVVIYQAKSTGVEYLIRGKRFNGKWKASVGGEINYKEYPVEAAKREVFEEHFGFMLGELITNHDIAFFDGKHKYLTLLGTLEVESEETLHEHVGVLNKAAEAANAALRAFTKELSIAEKLALAVTALGNEQYVKMLRLIEHGPLLVDMLVQLKNEEKTEEGAIIDFDSEEAEALKTFTEYSEFQVVELSVVKEDATPEETFKPEKKALFSLLGHYLE
mmetsp:Transcript_1912/g.2724  ORF Transcript_1912/g.2724 Transcript_1912/m.2724 type:complete len:284 (+) Transcript_1912:3004-3855(+)